MRLMPVKLASGAAVKRQRLMTTVLAGMVALVLVVSIVSLALAASSSFPDVPDTHPYYAAITDLATRGVISGFENGDFGPGDDVLRQQFAKMIVLAGGYAASEDDICGFPDVDNGGPTTLYPDNYVAVCAAHGITTGRTATSFDPYGTITRYQVLSMVVRAADDLHPGLLAIPPAGWIATSGWQSDVTHGANAARAEYNLLLAGIDLSASPYGNMTRGEVAQVLHNLLNKLMPPATTTTTVPTTTTTTTSSSTTTTTASSTTTTAGSGAGSTTTTTLVSQQAATDYVVAGLENAQVVLTIRDQFGNPLPFVEVRLTSTVLEGSGLATFSDFSIGSSDGNGLVVYSWGQDTGDWGVEKVTAWVDDNTASGFTKDVALIQWILDDTGTDNVVALNGQQKVTVVSGYTPWNGKTLRVHLAPLGAVLGSGTYVASASLSLSTTLQTWATGQVFFVGATSSDSDSAPNWMYNVVQ